MNPFTTSSLLSLGFMLGVQVMVIAFLAVMPAVVKIPEARSTRYLVSGSLTLIVSLILYGAVRNNKVFFMHLLILTGMLAGYVLMWMGDRYFRLQQPGKSMWLIAGTVYLTFAALGSFGLTPDMAAIFMATCAAMFWSFHVYKNFKSGFVRYTLPVCLLIIGAALMVANALFRIAVTSGQFSFLFSFAAENSNLAFRFVPGMLGGMLISISYLLRYFERVIQQSEHAAAHDELTGLLNRRAIVANGEREIALARRSRQPLAVAFVDIDFFKKINDVYGHDKGDLVLREVALVLQQNCRSVDLIGRYGGEEFCMILPGDDHDGAQIVGERLLYAVREHQISGLPPVTVSIGLAVLDLDRAQTWHSLINLADVELYKAKHGGRNRCAIAPKIAPLEEMQLHAPLQELASAR